MCVKNRIAALVCRALISLLALASVMIMLIVGGSFSMFIYYTILSNVLIAIFFGYLTVKTALQLKNEGALGEAYSANAAIHAGAVFVITVTFIGYAGLLANSGFTMSGATQSIRVLMSLSNLMLHYIVPFLAILELLVFFPKGRLKLSYAFLWLVAPLAYYVFTVIRSEIGGASEMFPYNAEFIANVATFFGVGLPYPMPEFGSYPYFFIDSSLFGWGFALCFALAFIAFCALVGLLFVGIDKLFVFIGKRRSKASE